MRRIQVFAFAPVPMATVTGTVYVPGRKIEVIDAATPEQASEFFVRHAAQGNIVHTQMFEEKERCALLAPERESLIDTTVRGLVNKGADCFEVDITIDLLRLDVSESNRLIQRFKELGGKY